MGALMGNSALPQLHRSAVPHHRTFVALHLHISTVPLFLISAVPQLRSHSSADPYIRSRRSVAPPIRSSVVLMLPPAPALYWSLETVLPPAKY